MKTPPPKFAVDSLPPDVLAEIGKIVAWWGYLQFQLGVILRESTRIRKDVGFLLTIGPNLFDLCKALRKVAGTSHWIRDDSIRNDLRKLAGDIQRASETRNSYAHGVFGFSAQSPTTFVRHYLNTTTTSTVSLDEEAITIHRLREVVSEVRLLWERAQDITHRLKANRRTGN